MEYLVFLYLVFIASSFYLMTRKRNTTSNTNLPPGSLGWPIIGETLELLMSHKKPETFILKRLVKHSEVFKTNILGENMVVFSGPEANKFVSANEGSLIRVWLPRSQQRLFGLDNTDKPHSPGLSRLFSVLRPDSNGVQKFDSVAKDRLKKMPLSCRAYEMAKGFVLTVSCTHLLGMDPERAAEAAEVWRLDEVVKGIQWMHVDFPGTVFWRARRAAEEVRTKVEAFMAEEVGEGGDNLVSVLSASNIKARITMANLVMGIMAASYGSVVATITFMVKLVGERPDVYDKIYSEQMGILALKGSDALNWNHVNKMKYTWAVACETMRIQPPFLGTFREALTDFEYAGFTIPKGWKILWAFNVTNKNPDYFPDPEKFEPSRFMENEKLPFTFLPFGGGPRMCAGKEYARLAILTFFHNLVTNFKWDILSPDEKISGSMGLGLPVLTNGLPIRLHPHINVTTKSQYA